MTATAERIPMTPLRPVPEFESNLELQSFKMEIWWIACFAAGLIVLAICALLCCAVSRPGLEQGLNLDNDPSPEDLPPYPGPIDPTGKYPLPPPYDPDMIPADLMADAEQFPSVTDRMTSEFIYQE